MSGGGISERYAVVRGREIRAIKGLDALSGCSGRKADVSCSHEAADFEWGSGATAIEGATDTLVRQQMLGAVAPAADGEPIADRIGITRP
jgi:hypothetical protein